MRAAPGDDEERRPAEAVGLVEGEEGGGEGGAEPDRAAKVEGLARRGVARVAHQDDDEGGRDQDEGNAEPEHGRPPPEVDEGAADHRPEHEGGREARRVPAEHPAPVPFREREGREGGAAAQQERDSRPLEDAGREQPAELRRKRAEDEGHRVPQEPDHEHPLVADDVREAPEPRHQARVGEDVADDHPLDGRDVVAERGRDGGERDVDRGVERPRRDPEGDDDEGEPRACRACLLRSGCAGVPHSPPSPWVRAPP